MRSSLLVHRGTTAGHASLFLALLLWAPAVAGAQLQQGTISGTVVGPDGAAIDDATVTLLDGSSNTVQSVG